MMLTFLSAAAPAATQEPPQWLSFLPLVGMAFIFWFLILRPQMRQQKAHKEKIAAMKKGDVVVTAGDLGGNVSVKAVRSTIGDIVPPGGTAPAND